MYKLKSPLKPSGKMEVTPEQSMNVQEHLFREGYRWKNDGLRVLNIDRNHYLIWYENKKISWSLPYNSAINHKNIPHTFTDHFETINNE